MLVHLHLMVLTACHVKREHSLILEHQAVIVVQMARFQLLVLVSVLHVILVHSQPMPLIVSYVRMVLIHPRLDLQVVALALLDLSHHLDHTSVLYVAPVLILELLILVFRAQRVHSQQLDQHHAQIAQVELSLSQARRLVLLAALDNLLLMVSPARIVLQAKSRVLLLLAVHLARLVISQSMALTVIFVRLEAIRLQDLLRALSVRAVRFLAMVRLLVQTVLLEHLRLMELLVKLVQAEASLLRAHQIVRLVMLESIPTMR